MLELIRSALKSGISASYVLFDTWFCSPSSLIAMAKKTPKIHYLVDGKNKSVKAIYSSCKKRRGRSRYLLSVDAAIQKNNSIIPVRLVFVRNRNNRNDYLVLITTDLTLSEDDIIRIYGKRWAIEVFFKVCKSYLKLTKSFRRLSFDAQTAHVAIFFTLYTMLSLENRFNLDVRSIGELFYWTCDELADITYQESYLLLIELMLSVCQDILQLSDEKMDMLLEQFLQNLPAKIKSSLKPSA